MIEGVLNIYTDGSSLSHPRRGGMAIRYIYNSLTGDVELSKDLELKGVKGATNNQMELQACIESLNESLNLSVYNQVNRIVIYTDSMYVVDNVNNAIYNWSKRNWCNKFGKPVANALQWRELIKLMQKTRKRVDFKWVKGHSKDEHNKGVDKLARQSAKKPLNEPLSYIEVRRKKSSKKIEPGSVKMQGQKIAIRIITSEWQRLQKLWKYKYEVESKGSRYYQNVDIIFCELVLRTTHTYLVTFNKNQNNPRILNVFSEIDQPLTNRN